MIPRPNYQSMPLAVGLKWTGGGYLYTEKKDGVFAIREKSGATIFGEQMRDGSFWAFDVLRIGGDDLQNATTRDRWAALRELESRGLQIVPAGNGGEFLEAVLLRGGEGVVAARLEAGFYESRFKCKREETHDCIVLEIHPLKESARLGQLDAGGRLVQRGWCAVLGGDGCAFWGNRRVDRLKVGDVVEIKCFGITAKDKFREPRFIRPRPDKRAAS
jgi:ATP-dependent DNA ligase